MKSYNLKMNLQLFADPSASLQNTTGTMTNEMKTFYEKRLIDQAEPDRKSTRLNSSHNRESRMPSSA